LGIVQPSEYLIYEAIPSEMSDEEIRLAFEKAGIRGLTKVQRVVEDRLPLSLVSELISLCRRDPVLVYFQHHTLLAHAYNMHDLSFTWRQQTIRPIKLFIGDQQVSLYRLLGMSEKRILQELWKQAADSVDYCSNTFGLELWRQMAALDMIDSEFLFLVFEACYNVKASCGLDTRSHLVAFLKEFPHLRTIAQRAHHEWKSRTSHDFSRWVPRVLAESLQHEDPQQKK